MGAIHRNAYSAYVSVVPVKPLANSRTKRRGHAMPTVSMTAPTSRNSDSTDDSSARSSSPPFCRADVSSGTSGMLMGAVTNPMTVVTASSASSVTSTM